MKYLTKEWYVTDCLSIVSQYIRVSKRAERKDEAFFQSTYQKRLKQFVSADEGNALYRNPQDDLKKIDAYIKEPNISEDERMRRERYKEDFIYLNEERIKSGIFYPFDRRVSEEKFAEDFNQRIALLKHLPQEILASVADIRLLALGYASAAVKHALAPYCAWLRSISVNTKRQAQAVTRAAEKKLSEKLDVNDYGDCMLLTGVEEQGGNLFLEFDGGDKLVIQNGVVLEGKEHHVYRYNPQVPNSGWSRVVAAELHYENAGFEIHFMISNAGEKHEGEIWYLTIGGTDIKEQECV